MKRFVQVVFDEYVYDLSVYSSDIFDQLLGSVDQLAVQAIVDDVAGTSVTLDVVLEDTNDGRAWTDNVALISDAAVVSRQVNVVVGTSDGIDNVVASRARLRVRLDGTSPQARVRLIVCGRDANSERVRAARWKAEQRAARSQGRVRDGRVGDPRQRSTGGKPKTGPKPAAPGKCMPCGPCGPSKGGAPGGVGLPMDLSTVMGGGGRSDGPAGELTLSGAGHHPAARSSVRSARTSARDGSVVSWPSMKMGSRVPALVERAAQAGNEAWVAASEEPGVESAAARGASYDRAVGFARRDGAVAMRPAEAESSGGGEQLNLFTPAGWGAPTSTHGNGCCCGTGEAAGAGGELSGDLVRFWPSTKQKGRRDRGALPPRFVPTTERTGPTASVVASPSLMVWPQRRGRALPSMFDLTGIPTNLMYVPHWFDPDVTSTAPAVALHTGGSRTLEALSNLSAARTDRSARAVPPDRVAGDSAVRLHPMPIYEEDPQTQRPPQQDTCCCCCCCCPPAPPAKLGFDLGKLVSTPASQALSAPVALWPPVGAALIGLPIGIGVSPWGSTAEEVLGMSCASINSQGLFWQGTAIADMLDDVTGDDQENAILRILSCGTCDQAWQRAQQGHEVSGIGEGYKNFQDLFNYCFDGDEQDKLDKLFFQCGMINASAVSEEAIHDLVVGQSCQWFLDLFAKNSNPKKAIKALLDELFEGDTGEDDEDAIYGIVWCLNQYQPAVLQSLLNTYGYMWEDFDEEVGGSQWDALTKIFNPYDTE